MSVFDLTTPQAEAVLMWLKTHACVEDRVDRATVVAIEYDFSSGIGPAVTARCERCTKTLGLTDVNTW